MRVLDRQAPDVEVITDSNNDVDDKGPIHTNRHTKHEEHVRHLVHIVAQRAGPSEPRASELKLQPRAQRVEDTVGQRQHQDVGVGELQLHEVRRNHLPDRVGVDNAAEHGEGDQMVVQDVGLQQQVGDDQGPGDEERHQADERVPAAVTTGPSSLNDVAARLDGVEAEHHKALDHVPVRKGHVVDNIWDVGLSGDANGLQGRVRPDVPAA